MALCPFTFVGLISALHLYSLSLLFAERKPIIKPNHPTSIQKSTSQNTLTRQGVRRIPCGGLARIHSAPDIQRRACSQFVPERLCFRINQTGNATRAPGSFWGTDAFASTKRTEAHVRPVSSRKTLTLSASLSTWKRDRVRPLVFQESAQRGSNSKVETTAAERAIIGRLVGGSSLGFGEATAAERAIIGRAFSTSGGESLSTT